MHGHHNRQIPCAAAFPESFFNAPLNDIQIVRLLYPMHDHVDEEMLCADNNLGYETCEGSIILVSIILVIGPMDHKSSCVAHSRSHHVSLWVSILYGGYVGVKLIDGYAMGIVSWGISMYMCV